MKRNMVGIFWGLLLIFAGSLVWAAMQGLLDRRDANLWIAVYAAISLVSLLTYAVSGIRNWTVLLPAGIFGGLALLVWQGSRGIDNAAMVAPLFAGIGLPFLAGYLIDRVKNWWALIPAGVMAALMFVLVLADFHRGQFVGPAVLFMLAAVFGAAYFMRRSLLAGVAAYILLAVGLMALFSLLNVAESAGAIVLFAIAVPFFALYLRMPEKRYWAILPAVILAIAGVLAASTSLLGLFDDATGMRVANAAMFAGISAACAVIWLRHNRRWAGGAMALALALAAGSFVFGNMDQLWPLAIVLIGMFVVFRALRPALIQGQTSTDAGSE